METRFSRSEISSINNLRNGNNNTSTNNSRKLYVPKEESFTYILNRAKSGNEMAAVQIDEWYRFCRARNSSEKCVLNQIRKAADEIFE